MKATHTYQAQLRWTGNRGSGTSSYRGYGREHEVLTAGKPTILGSSDPEFRGDRQRWNPEELLVVALSQCHMLWYLHLAAVQGVVVTDYTDAPTGTMQEDDDGGGRFTGVVLRPSVTVTDPTMLALADALHDESHRKCFIANSVGFPVVHEPTSSAGSPDREPRT